MGDHDHPAVAGVRELALQPGRLRRDRPRRPSRRRGARCRARRGAARGADVDDVVQALAGADRRRRSTRGAQPRHHLAKSELPARRVGRHPDDRSAQRLGEQLVDRAGVRGSVGCDRPRRAQPRRDRETARQIPQRAIADRQRVRQRRRQQRPRDQRVVIAEDRVDGRADAAAVKPPDRVAQQLAGSAGRRPPAGSRTGRCRWPAGRRSSPGGRCRGRPRRRAAPPARARARWTGRCRSGRRPGSPAAGTASGSRVPAPDSTCAVSVSWGRKVD